MIGVVVVAMCCSPGDASRMRRIASEFAAKWFPRLASQRFYMVARSAHCNSRPAPIAESVDQGFSFAAPLTRQRVPLNSIARSRNRSWRGRGTPDLGSVPQVIPHSSMAAGFGGWEAFATRRRRLRARVVVLRRSCISDVCRERRREGRSKSDPPATKGVVKREGLRESRRSRLRTLCGLKAELRDGEYVQASGGSASFTARVSLRMERCVNV